MRAAFLGFLRGLAACALVALLLWSGKDYRPTESEEAIAAYRFNLLAWEVGNVFDKWYHELLALLPWNSPPSRPERIALAEEFFRLGQEERRLEAELLILAESSPEADEIRRRLEEIHDRQDNIRPVVEQTVEREISAVLADEGFSSRIGAILPPVDTVLGHSPALLVTSPRDRIFRQDNILLRHGVRPDEREALEGHHPAGTQLVRHSGEHRRGGNLSQRGVGRGQPAFRSQYGGPRVAAQLVLLPAAGTTLLGQLPR